MFNFAKLFICVFWPRLLNICPPPPHARRVPSRPAASNLRLPLSLTMAVGSGLLICLVGFLAWGLPFYSLEATSQRPPLEGQSGCFLRQFSKNLRFLRRFFYLRFQVLRPFKNLKILRHSCREGENMHHTVFAVFLQFHIFGFLQLFCSFFSEKKSCTRAVF